MSCVQIGAFGISFKTADLRLREEVAKAASSFHDEWAIFFPHPTILLSTCNRTELYFSGCNLAQVHSDLLAWLRTRIEEPFEHKLYSYFGIDCFAHLCKVTAGLDSAIFRETEIQRQVKLAYLKSKERIRLPGCMHYAFQKALKVGKEIRGKAEQRGSKLYSALWSMADWRNKKILLVGHSGINRGFASFLIHKGVSGFSISTKRPELVHIEGAKARDRSLLKNWQQFDLIVSATQSEDFLIQGKGNGQIIFDLSVPRNVDPEVGESTFLYNIDQLVSEEKGDSSLDELVWEHVIRLAQIYRLKNRHVQGNGETESHLLCSPCQSRIRQVGQAQGQIRHEEQIHILLAQGTTNNPLG